MSSPEHFKARDRQIAAATAEFAKWFASQTPQEKARLKALGLDHVPADSDKVSGHSARISDEPTAHHTAAFDVASLDTYADQLAQEFDLDEFTSQRLATHVHQILAKDRATRLSTTLNSIIGVLLRSENVKTCAAGLAYAAGLAEVNFFGTIRAYAAKNGLSPEAISKATKKWRETLHLPNNAHSKPPKACKAFADAQRQKHWRNQKFKATPTPKP